MSSPIYNFYNCCKSDCCSPNNTSSNGNQKALFPFKTVRAGLTSDPLTGNVYDAHPYLYQINDSGAGSPSEIYTNMEAFHFPFRVKELSIIKTGVSGTTTENYGIVYYCHEHVRHRIAHYISFCRRNCKCSRRTMDFNSPDNRCGRLSDLSKRNCHSKISNF